MLISATVIYTLPLCLSVALITDFTKMIIPNSVSLALLGSFIFIAYPAGLDTYQIAISILTGFAVFFAGLVLYAIKQMGAGDVKLLSCCALWFGFGEPLLIFLLLVSVIGAIFVIAIAALRWFSSYFGKFYVYLPTHIIAGRKIPYGVAICAAGLIVFPETTIMKLAIARMAIL